MGEDRARTIMIDVVENGYMIGVRRGDGYVSGPTWVARNLGDLLKVISEIIAEPPADDGGRP